MTETIRVEVLTDGRVLVAGEAIDVPDSSDPYSAAIDVLAGYAKSSGQPVIADGIDQITGEASRFTVDADGQAGPASYHSGTPASGSSAAPIAGMPEWSSAQPVGSSQPGTDAPPPSVPQSAYDSAQAASAPPAPVASLETQFVRPDRPRPAGGFRGAVYAATGGLVNLGPSTQDLEEAELERRIARPLSGSFNTAVLSLKGGIGKTSTTVGVGMILAEYRGDHPCAIDANPDSGDLAERALGESMYQKARPRTITEIVRDIEKITSLTVLRDYMHHAGRLHLIAGEQDPALSDALTAEEYLTVKNLISQFYSVTLTDCGTGVSHPAMTGVLNSASNLVIASGYAVSGAKRARNTLKWLGDHGYAHLATNALVVITDKDQVSNRVDKRAIEDTLSGYCRQLVTVPHDRGVADGDRITTERMQSQTRRAYKEIAAAIVDGYV